MALARSGNDAFTLRSENLSISAHLQEGLWVLELGDSRGPEPQPLLEIRRDVVNGVRESRNPCFQECIPRVTEAGSGEFLLVGRDPHQHHSAVLQLTDNQLQLEVAERWTKPLEMPSNWLTCKILDATWQTIWRLNALTRQDDQLSFQPASLVNVNGAIRVIGTAPTDLKFPLTIRYGLSISINF